MNKKSKYGFACLWGSMCIKSAAVSSCLWILLLKKEVCRKR